MKSVHFHVGLRCHLVHTSIYHSTVIISPVDIKISRIHMSPDPQIAEPNVVLLLIINYKFNKFMLLHSQQRFYYYRIGNNSSKSH